MVYQHQWNQYPKYTDTDNTGVQQGCSFVSKCPDILVYGLWVILRLLSSIFQTLYNPVFLFYWGPPPSCTNSINLTLHITTTRTINYHYEVLMWILSKVWKYAAISEPTLPRWLLKLVNWLKEIETRDYINVYVEKVMTSEDILPGLQHQSYSWWWGTQGLCFDWCCQCRWPEPTRTWGLKTSGCHSIHLWK